MNTIRFYDTEDLWAKATEAATTLNIMTNYAMTREAFMVSQSTEAIGQAISGAASAVGGGIKTGATAVGNGVATGAKATANFAKAAGPQILKAFQAILNYITSIIQGAVIKVKAKALLAKLSQVQQASLVANQKVQVPGFFKKGWEQEKANIEKYVADLDSANKSGSVNESLQARKEQLNNMLGTQHEITISDALQAINEITKVTVVAGQSGDGRVNLNVQGINTFLQSVLKGNTAHFQTLNQVKQRITSAMSVIKQKMNGQMDSTMLQQWNSEVQAQKMQTKFMVSSLQTTLNILSQAFGGGETAAPAQQQTQAQQPAANA